MLASREGVNLDLFTISPEAPSAQEIPAGAVYIYIYMSDSLRMEKKSVPAVITSSLPQVCNIAVLLASFVSFPALSFPVNYVDKYRLFKRLQ